MSEGPTNQPRLSWTYGCPFCGTPVRLLADACSFCALPLQDARAVRVSAIDSDLMETGRRRAILMTERNQLLGAHTPPSGSAPYTVPYAELLAGQSTQPSAGGPAGLSGSPELRRRDTQATLLALGGILLALAALVFAVVTWNHSGPAARVTILLAVTSLAAYSPKLLLGRQLRDTAETMASVAVAMTAVDVLLLRHLVAPRVHALSFWAVADVVLAGAFFGYGRLTGLRSPHVIAAVTAQFPLLLLAARISAGPQATAVFVAATVALDGAAWWWLRESAGPLGQTRVVVEVSALILSAAGSLLAVRAIQERWQDTPAVLVACAVLLAFAAGAAIYAAVATHRTAEAATIACVLALGTVAVAIVNVLRVDSLLGVGTVLAIAAGAAIATALVFSPAFRLGALPAGALSLAGAASIVVPLVGLAAREEIWTGATRTLTPGFATCVVVSLLAMTATAYLLTDALGLLRRPILPFAAGGLVAVVVALPLTVPLSATVVAWLTFAVGASMVVALVATRSADQPIPWGLAAALALHGVALVAPDNRQLSLVLLALAVVMGASVVCNIQRAPAVAITILAATGAVAAALLVSGRHAIPAYVVTLVVPVLAAAGLVVADRRDSWRLSPDATLAAEVAAAGAAIVAMIATFETSGPGWSAWALAIAGVAVLAQSLRPTRRDAWYAGVALLTAASWIHLWIADVRWVEAYSVPVSLVVLAVGAARRRSEPALKSAQAYGSGLSGLLLPSLLAGFSDASITRSVVVLVVAAAIAVLGASYRLLAPLAIGGAVALADALWLAAPHVAAMPRWVSLGTVGVVLLFVGATYERRRLQAQQLTEQLRDFA